MGPPADVAGFEMPLFLTSSAVLVGVRPIDGSGRASFALTMPAVVPTVDTDVYFQAITATPHPSVLAMTQLEVLALD